MGPAERSGFDPRLGRIAAGLLNRTQSGDIQWEAVTIGSTVQFDYSTPKNTITIRTRGGIPDLPVMLIVKNDDGVELERFTTGGEREGPTNNVDAIVRRLYDSVRRQALRIDSALDELAQTLGDDYDSV